VVGTLLVCGGIFYCDFLDGESTEEKGVRKDSKNPVRSTLDWVQLGGQILGDQTFDSFAYSEESPLRKYTRLWKKQTEKSQLGVWAAVGITVVGFVLQFVGLRAVHSAISVTQLGAMIVMSMARAVMRMRRFLWMTTFFRLNLTRLSGTN